MGRGAWWARVHRGHRSDMTYVHLKAIGLSKKKKKRERGLIYILRGSFLGGGEKGRLHQLKRVYILNFRSLGGSDGKVCLQCGRPGFHPCVGKIPWRRKWQPTPVFLPEESHG